MQNLFSNLSLVLYGCETWSVALREERRLGVFEDRVVWKIFGPKKDEAVGDWRTLHDGEFCDLYSSPNNIGWMRSRRMRWAWHVARMGYR